MSTAHVEISHDLIEGIFTVLDTHVTYGGTTYPVYKSIPKNAASVYVKIGEVIGNEDGTKDEFMYYGTVQVKVIDEAGASTDKTLARAILGVTRGLLLPSRGAALFSCAPRTLVVFTPGPYNDFVEQSDKNISRKTVVDIYNFVIQ